MTTAQVVETSVTVTKVLFRTTLTRTITLDKLRILLGSNHLLFKFGLEIFEMLQKCYKRFEQIHCDTASSSLHRLPEYLFFYSVSGTYDLVVIN